MNKAREEAKVNSSYTVFFLLATLGIAFVFSNSFGELQNETWVTITCLALLIYFVWDFIRQLYSPGQALLLFTLTFIILPLVHGWIFDHRLYIASLLVWLGASILGGISELLYELLFKSVAPKSVVKRLLATDSAIDRSMLRLNDMHLSFLNLRGIVVYLIVVVLYFILASVLLLN